jgi:hypothetical protein
MVNKALETERDRLEVDALPQSACKRTPGSRPRATQGAAPAPSHGGGTYTANYHRPAHSTSTRRQLHQPLQAACTSPILVVASQAIGLLSAPRKGPLRLRRPHARQAPA